MLIRNGPYVGVDMESASIISKAKEFLVKNQPEKARKLLLKEGFIRRLDPSIQEAYEQLVPPGGALREQLEGSLAFLKDSDPNVRYKAASRLCKEALKEWSFHREAWLADPRTTSPLIQTLSDEDPKVAEKAAAALAAIMRSYFPDLRAFEPLVRLLRSRRKNTRLYAVLGIGSVNYKQRWDILLEMLNDTTTEVRRGACRSLIDSLDDCKIATTTKSKLIARLQTLLSDKDDTIRAMADTVLGTLKG